MRLLLIIAGLIEFGFGLLLILNRDVIATDIQLTIVMVLLGFGLTHVGTGLLIPDDNYKTWRRLAKFLDANEPPKEPRKARSGGLGGPLRDSWTGIKPPLRRKRRPTRNRHSDAKKPISVAFIAWAEKVASIEGPRGDIWGDIKIKKQFLSNKTNALD